LDWTYLYFDNVDFNLTRLLHCCWLSFCSSVSLRRCTFVMVRMEITIIYDSWILYYNNLWITIYFKKKLKQKSTTQNVQVPTSKSLILFSGAEITFNFRVFSGIILLAPSQINITWILWALCVSCWTCAMWQVTVLHENCTFVHSVLWTVSRIIRHYWNNIMKFYHSCVLADCIFLSVFAVSWNW